MRAFLVLCAASVVACGGATAASSPTPAASAASAHTSVEEPGSGQGRPAAPTPPSGYVRMTAAGVAAAGEDAQAVGLVDQEGSMVLRIFVGGTEAMTIALRLYKQPFTRPLTHDLMDEMLDKLDAKVYKVQIDDLVEGVFVGSVFIHRGARVWELDARPSDAIAIAIGHNVPIYVSAMVLQQAAQSASMNGGEEEKVTPKPGP